ncbi:hypothetical protein HY628_03000 [Candidatus Uhrbacteria bacterium]|nr:hypothetical protein [Candidatus Uhrbacteria bacterium]
MSEIIPAILVSDVLQFKRKIDALEGRVEEVQIDLMDGLFVPQTSLADPSVIRAFSTKLGYELHLMVDDPASVIEAWSVIPNVRRVIPHAEISQPLAPLIDQIHGLGWQAGLALNPETPWQTIDDLIPELDTVLVMTVPPGKSGQSLAEAAVEHHLLSKISELHRCHPGLIISADGGVNAETIPLLAEAGVTRFTMGSAIWQSSDPLAALKEFQNQLNRLIT